MAIRALVACFVVASGTVATAQLTPSQSPAARLFEAQPRTPDVICGTRVIRADPNIDPKFVRAAPRGIFTLRTLQPPVCRDTFPTPSADLKQRLPQFLGPKR
jgi:hypothetical protein